MTKLTQEQLQTIEDAFNSLPEDMRTGRYRNMEGIQEQLDSGAKLPLRSRKPKPVATGTEFVRNW